MDDEMLSSLCSLVGAIKQENFNFNVFMILFRHGIDALWPVLVTELV